jgi:hypothetical protein
MAWFSPYILADGQVDTRSLDTIVADRRFAAKQGEELAVALWRWLIDQKEGFYHFLAGTEEPGRTLTADPVKDPLRLLNTYGYGLCGNVAMVFAALYDWAGGTSRVVGVPGHTISEARWDGAWHLIDCDLRALHYNKTERGYEIASLHDLVSDPNLVANPVRKSDPYYVSDQHAKDTAEQCYRPGRETYYPHYFYRLGSMDYVLRAGESLTCYYQPHGRFYWGRDWGEWIKGDDLNRFTGPCDKKDPSRRYADACIRWRPNLHTDLDEVGVECGGFDKVDGGLLAESPDAAVRYRLVSPYLICGRYERFDPARKRMEAVLARLNASAAPIVTITAACDGQARRVPLQQDRDEYLADLTEWVDLHYEYELSINVPAGQTLRSVGVDTWCQASVTALPRWFEPGRPVRLAAGSAWKDVRGGAVLPHLVDLLAPGRPSGEAVAVEPPIPGRIVRVHAMAAIPSVKESAAGGEVVLDMATAPDGPFHAIGRRPVSMHPQGFHFCVEGIATLPVPAGKVWLRLRCPPAVDVWRARLDYEPQVRPPSAGCATHGGMAALSLKPTAAPADEPVDVLLRWRQDGKLRTYTRRMSPGDLDKPFVPVVEQGAIRPLHLVLSVPSRD